MSEQTIKSSIKCVNGLSLFIEGMEDLGNYPKGAVTVPTILEGISDIFIDPLGAQLLSIIYELDQFMVNSEGKDEEAVQSGIKGYMDRIANTIKDYQEMEDLDG